MTRNRGRHVHGNIFRSMWALAALGILVTACGNAAESREGPEGQEIPAYEGNAGEEAATAQPEAAPPLLAIPAGTRLVFEVGETVSTSSHSAGDTFVLRLAETVGGMNGLTLEAGTTARGTVTVAARSTGPDEEAVLAFRVESLRVEGRNRALNGVVEEAETDASTGDSRTRSAAKVATGAAAGAVVGQILGRDSRSTAQGAAAGAVAGLGVALTTRDGHAVLPEGSLVTVRLEDSLVVN
jgi:hypothetical protein